MYPTVGQIYVVLHNQVGPWPYIWTFGKATVNGEHLDNRNNRNFNYKSIIMARLFNSWFDTKLDHLVVAHFFNCKPARTD